VIADIAAAFNSADPTLGIEVSYGRGLDQTTIEGKLRAGEKVNVIIDVTQMPDSQVAQATRGVYKEGTLMMYSFAKNDKAAIDNLQAWWLNLAGDSGNLLHDISGKVTLGTVEFLRWRAVGGFQGSATRFGGNVWMCDQLVDYAAWLPP
jgi:hypothetical protein